MSHQFGKGGIRDIADERDYLWAEVGFGAAPFDWTKGFDIEVELQTILNNPAFKIPVKDQNGSGSCGGQAWSYQSEVLEAFATKSFEERSAKFIYAQTFVAPDGGTYGRDNAELVVNQGDARETILTSYDNGKPPSEAFMQRKQDITPAATADAKTNRELSYANVNCDIESFATAIRDNHGLVLGLDGEDNGTWLSPFPKSPSKRVWGHWLYAGKVKMIDGKKYIGIINSWGNSVGQSGWQWLGEDYFASGHIWNGWTHVYNSQVVTPGFKHTFTQEMDFGSIGSEVFALQQALQIDGEFSKLVPATGLFGLITRSAVQAFQKKYGIATSGTPSTTGYGRVGPKTITQLNKLFS